MNRQKLILFILLIVFVFSLGYSFIRMPKQKKIATLTYTPGASTLPSRRTSATKADEKRVRLDLLDMDKSHFNGFRRNIFRPIFHDEVILPSPLPQMLPKPVPPPLKPVAPPALPPPLPEPPQVVRDMARFTFLGFLKKENKKTIFLTKDKEIVLVKQGDKVAGKYEATSITDEALTIRSLGDGSEIIIPLVENKPLSPKMR